MTLRTHLAGLPAELADAVEAEYLHLVEHMTKSEWDDAQVDAGRFCEAVLRVIEWHTADAYTPIDGKNRPDRKKVVNAVAKNTTLPSSLRLQIPQCVELMMDFRNTRNAAHLGNVDASRTDATCVAQLATWVTCELVRLETQRPPSEVQTLIDQLSARHVPLVQIVNGRPVLLNPSLSAEERAVVILQQQARPVQVDELRRFTEYGNTTRWRRTIIPGLVKKRWAFVDDDDNAHLLEPGAAVADKLILAANPALAA